MRAYKNRSQLLMIFLVVGFFVGILYENVMSSNSLIVSELFSEKNLHLYLATEIVTRSYLWYVLKARIVILGMICILGCVKWKKMYVALLLCTVGFLAGIITVTVILHFGVKGILLCVAGILPQIIFYGMGLTILIPYWFWFPERRWNRAKTIFVICMFLIGVLSETYINPLLLKIVVRWMI